MTDSKKTLDEKCWKGYKKKGMKTMFGKRYPNCVKVKKEEFSDWRSEFEQIEEIDYDQVIEGSAGVLKDTIFPKKPKEKKMSASLLDNIRKVNTGAGSQYEEVNMIGEKKIFPQGFLEKHPKLDPKNIRDFNKLKRILRQDNKKGLAMSTNTFTEKMDLKKADMGDVITDFRKSDAPQFKGKSDKKIQKMAIAAKLDAMESLDSKDVPVIKGIIKKLDGASKKHKNQSIALKKAVDENVMLTYRSGQGFDAKLGGKSVRNTVKNIKTGVDAVKNIKKEKGIVKGIKKTINDKKTTNTKTDVSTNVGDAIKNFKMKENTAIESELTIQDWNVDEIKYTEVEAVDIIKPEPLKPSPSNIVIDEGFKQRMIAKLGKNLIKKVGKVNPFTKTGAQRVTQGSNGVIKKVTKKVTPPFKVTGKEAAKMQRSKTGLDFPVDKATSQNIQTQSVKNQAKKLVDMSKKPNKGTKAVKVDLSKPIDFDKYFGKTPNKIQKKFGSTKPTGTFTDDLPPVKTVPLKKSQKKIVKKFTMKDKMKEIENDPMSQKIKKQIESETGTKTRKFSQKGGITKGNENETLSNIKPKKPLKDHYDWRGQLETELDEDWQKVNRKDKTDGLSQKAVNAYRKENPGSKLKTAVTKDPKKLKKGSKSAKRRLSFCRRMKGMKKKLTSAKTSRDPNSRINKALRRWNC